MAAADAVVIGAGVVGSSIALELARSGCQVVVVDKSGGAGHGSTSASSGIVRFHYSTYAGVALSWESLHGWRDWAGLLGKIPVAVVARPGDAIRSRLSPAAQRFRDARVDAGDANALLEMRPPAWLYLTARLNAASSTALRAGAGSR